MVRKPAVAGYFYPGEERELRKLLASLVNEEIEALVRSRLEGIRELHGVVSPHAGYVYSGKVAAYSFYALSLCLPVETIILIGPNHRGIGEKIALAGEDFWQTPLGLIPIDREATHFLSQVFPSARIDSLAHQLEHSLEVQLPFLQFFLSYRFHIVPIALAWQDLSIARELAQALRELARQEKIVVIASSDFSHYEPARVVEEKDHTLIAHILSLDTEGFYRDVYEKDLSICGPGGVATLMEYHRGLSAKKPELLCYAHSGEVTGELRQVVGYTSIIFPNLSP